MHFYIYARDLGKKCEKKHIFQAYFFVKKSIYAPEKSFRELLGHTLVSQRPQGTVKNIEIPTFGDWWCLITASPWKWDSH